MSEYTMISLSGVAVGVTPELYERLRDTEGTTLMGDTMIGVSDEVWSWVIHMSHERGGMYEIQWR